MTDNIIYDSVVIDTIEDVEGDALLIKGMANAYLSKGKEVVIDDWGTTFTPMSFDIVEYVNNPVILFQHDMSIPVGTATKVEKREEGLYIEAMIYKNSDETTYYNIRNKVIRMFSVGVHIQEEYWSDVLDAWVIVKANLVEISVVPFPSNTQSHIEEVSLCDSGVCTVIRGKAKTPTTRSSKQHDLNLITNMVRKILNEDK